MSSKESSEPTDHEVKEFVRVAGRIKNPEIRRVISELVLGLARAHEDGGRKLRS